MEVSIVIPTYNSEKTIEDVLNSLFREIKRYKNKVEVIVVDDGSKDKTLSTVKKFHVKIFKQKHKGPASARNLGWKKAKGEIVIFLDSDCKVSKGWFKKMLSPFKDPKVGGVCVKYKTWNEENWVARFVGYEIGQRQERVKRETDYLATYSTGYRKEILKKLNGFDTSFGIAAAEDNDFSYRVKNMGYKLIFLKDCWVLHRHPESLKVYFKKQFYQAKWRVFLYLKWFRKKPKVLMGDQYAGVTTLVQPFIYLFLFISPLISFNLFIFLLIISFLIHLPLSISVLRNGDWVGFLIPFLFFQRGCVWCLGMIFGILSFLKNKLI